MRGKELKLEEIEASHTLGGWSRGRSCRGEREVERMHMLLCCRNIHYSLLVAQGPRPGRTARIRVGSVTECSPDVI
jgi:hypothetical protein